MKEARPKRSRGARLPRVPRASRAGDGDTPVPSRLTGVSYVEGVEVIEASTDGGGMEVQSVSGQVRAVVDCSGNVFQWWRVADLTWVGNSWTYVLQVCTTNGDGVDPEGRPHPLQSLLSTIQAPPREHHNSTQSVRTRHSRFLRWDLRKHALAYFVPGPA